jgi:hypothetical protein
MNCWFPGCETPHPKDWFVFRVAGVYTQFLRMFSLLEIKQSYAEELEYGRIWEYQGEWPATSSLNSSVDRYRLHVDFLSTRAMGVSLVSTQR